MTRQKPYIRDLERAAAAARTAQRQSDEAAALLQRQLGQMRQAQQQEVEALAAELNKARHTVRWVYVLALFDCWFVCRARVAQQQEVEGLAAELKARHTVR